MHSSFFENAFFENAFFENAELPLSCRQNAEVLDGVLREERRRLKEDAHPQIALLLNGNTVLWRLRAQNDPQKAHFRAIQITKKVRISQTFLVDL